MFVTDAYVFLRSGKIRLMRARASLKVKCSLVLRASNSFSKIYLGQDFDEVLCGSLQ